jgi:uncharacterized membrane protein YkoI
MRFNPRIAISVLVGAVLLTSLGVGIWKAQGDNSTIGSNDKAAITADQAIAVALAAHPGAAAVHTALEKERGVLLYSVKLNIRQEVKVDANTGQVLSDDDDD